MLPERQSLHLQKDAFHGFPVVLVGNPPDDGTVVYLEATGDRAAWAAFFGCALADVLWEGVTRELGCFVGVALCSNQFGWTAVVRDYPDRLPPAVYQSLLTSCLDRNVPASQPIGSGRHSSRGPRRATWLQSRSASRWLGCRIRPLGDTYCSISPACCSDPGHQTLHPGRTRTFWGRRPALAKPGCVGADKFRARLATKAVTTQLPTGKHLHVSYIFSPAPR